MKPASLYLHPKAKKKMKRPEQAMQIGVATELYKLEALSKQQDFFFFHPPNGGWRSGVEAGIMKAMGTRAGVSDLFLMFPAPDPSIEDGEFPQPVVVIIEFKAGKGDTTDKQDDFAAMCKRFGFEWHLVAAMDIQDAVLQTLRILRKHLPDRCQSSRIIDQYLFPGGVRV